MYSPKDGPPYKLKRFLGRFSSPGAVGSVGATAGAVIVAIGLVMEGNSEGSGAALRAVGGALLVGGLILLFFGDARRRAATINSLKRLVARYLARTTHWGWPDRYGLAAMVLGFAWVVPSLAIQIFVGNSYGIVIIGVLVFWGGFALLIYGRFYKRGEASVRRRNSSERSHKEGRGRRERRR